MLSATRIPMTIRARCCQVGGRVRLLATRLSFRVSRCAFYRSEVAEAIVWRDPLTGGRCEAILSLH